MSFVQTPAKFTSTGIIESVSVLRANSPGEVRFEGASLIVDISTVTSIDEDVVRTGIAGLLQAGLRQSGIPKLAIVTVIYGSNAFMVTLGDAADGDITGPFSGLYADRLGLNMGDITARVAPALDQFRQQYPQFNSVSDREVQSAIDIACELHGISEQAQLAAAAHIIEIEFSGGGIGSGGVIQTEQIGPKRVTYLRQAGDDRKAFFSATRYGQLYLSLTEDTVGLSVRVW